MYVYTIYILIFVLIIGIVLGECVENKLVLSLYIVRSRGSIMRVKYDEIMCCVNVCVYIIYKGSAQS